MLKLAEARGTIYKAEAKGNLVKASMQTAKKNGEQWENMWWNVIFVGKQKEEILQCGDKTKINITNGYVENKKVEKDGKATIYTNVVVFDFEVLDSKPKATEPAEDEEFPF